MEFYVYRLDNNYWAGYGWTRNIRDAKTFGAKTLPENNNGWQLGGPCTFTERMKINL